MARLQPTLFIGVGSTGMRILNYLQKFIVEEYGTWRFPVLQYVAFETIKQIEPGEYPTLQLEPIYLDALGLRTVANRMREEQHLAEKSPRVVGYEDWLSKDILNMGDAFENGAGGIRPAGRLILWENWNKVQNVLRRSYRACQNPENRVITINEIQSYYQNNGIQIPPGEGLLGEGVHIRVVGTLCGGSCGGMFADLGFMLREMFPASQRVLTVTMLGPQEALSEENYKRKANCLGALEELDFYYQHLPNGAWSYALEDGTTRAEANEDPYHRVYLQSTSNGDSHLEEKGLNQMIAMDMFLDTVGGGRSAKEGAIADIEDFLGARHRDDNGYVRYFCTFGLGAVWYPKSKITGTAACQLATRFCEAWKGSTKEDTHAPLDATTMTKPVDPFERGRATWKQFNEWVDATLAAGSDPSKNLYEEISEIVNEQAKRSNAVNQFDVPLRATFDEGLRAMLEERLDAVERRTKNLMAEAVNRFELAVRRVLLNDFQNCAMIHAFLGAIKEEAQGKPSQTSSKGKDKQKTSRLALSKSPDLRTLDVLRTDIGRVRKDVLVLLVGQKRPAVRAYRRAYVKRFERLWSEHARQTVSFYKRKIVEHLLNSWDEISMTAHRIASKVQEVSELVAREMELYAELGNSPQVVCQVFEDQIRKFAGDVALNIQRIEEANRNPSALSIVWHLSEERLPKNIKTPSDFWDQPPQTIAEQLIGNYQREGLRHLQDPQQLIRVVTGNNPQLQALSSAARPYQEINERYRKVLDATTKNFVFGYQRDPLDGVAAAAQLGDISERTANATGIKHLLFIYREERGLAIDMLRTHSAIRSGQHLKAHPYHWTHQNPDWFNWRRFENQGEAEMLMECCLLFPDIREKVFECFGDTQYSFKAVVNGQYERFTPGEKSEYARMAATPGATEQLRDRIRQILSQSNKEHYLENISLPADGKLDATIHAAKTSGDAGALELATRKKELLKKFNETIVAGVYR